MAEAFDCIIVGKGMMGAAAARHLSCSGAKIALIGPDEPEDWSSHGGVFSSHYDNGRITRTIDSDPVWALLARRSIRLGVDAPFVGEHALADRFPWFRFPAGYAGVFEPRNAGYINPRALVTAQARRDIDREGQLDAPEYETDFSVCYG